MSIFWTVDFPGRQIWPADKLATNCANLPHEIACLRDGIGAQYQRRLETADLMSSRMAASAVSAPPATKSRWGRAHSRSRIVSPTRQALLALELRESVQVVPIPWDQALFFRSSYLTAMRLRIGETRFASKIPKVDLL